MNAATARRSWILAAAVLGTTGAPASAARWGAPEPLPMDRVASQIVLDPGGAHRAVLGNAIASRRADRTWAASPVPEGALLTNVRGDVLSTTRRSDAGAVVVEAIVTPAAGPPRVLPLANADASTYVVEADLGSAGDAAVAWVAADGLRVAYHDAATGWEAATHLPAARPPRVSVAVSANGTAVALWTESSASGAVVRASRNVGSGAGWEPAREVDSAASTPGLRVELAIDGTGTAIGAWAQDTGRRGIRQVRSARLDPSSGTWTVDPPQGSETRGVLVAMSEQGNAILAWIAPAATDGPRHLIMARRKPTGGAWGPPEVVARPPADVLEVDAAIADDGAAVVGWTRLSPFTFVLPVAPMPQAATAAADAPWSGEVDLDLPETVEFGGQILVAISDASHAGASWYRSDSGGAGTFGRFAEYSPAAQPAGPRSVGIRSIEAPTSGRARSLVRLGPVLSAAVDGAPAVLERRVGRRWVAVRRVRLYGHVGTVWARLPSIGPHTFRVRMVGQGGRRAISRPVTVLATRWTSRTVVPCARPFDAVVRGWRASVLCRGEDATLVLRRMDLSTRRPIGPPIRLGPSWDLGERLGATLADDGRTIWVARGTSLVAVNRRTGAVGPSLALPALAVADRQVIAVGGGGVALLGTGIETLTRVDAASGRVTADLELPIDAQAFTDTMAVGPAGTWISRESRLARERSHLHVGASGDVLRIRRSGALSLDPPV